MGIGHGTILPAFLLSLIRQLKLPEEPAHLCVLQDGKGVLPGGHLVSGLGVGLDPADVLAPAEAPLLEAVPPCIQPLCAPTPACNDLSMKSAVICQSVRSSLHNLGPASNPSSLPHLPHTCKGAPCRLAVTCCAAFAAQSGTCMQALCAPTPATHAKNSPCEMLKRANL